jgi:1-deoxy-D-xylulose-5-phosphate reductoisomerase
VIGVVILGATGSVGLRAAEVVAAHPERFRVSGLAAHRRGDALLDLGRRLRAPRIALVDPQAAAELRPRLRPGDPELRAGTEGLLSLLEERDAQTVLQAISGAAGLDASLLAARSGLRLALANKESMVVAGPLLMREARASGAQIVPVDSEHSAIHQCLRAGRPEEVRRLVLTASGGPFLGADRERLSRVTPAEALRHPTWDMGRRITVDSATLLNKALEIVEARWLFDVPAERIEVVVHPQSVVHSMVEFVDGSVVAQMGPPDMRTPVRYALGFPDRLPSDRPRFDVRDYANLTFLPPDRDVFPGLDLGFAAARRGGTAGAALNAADEVAVARFLGGALAFDRIAAACASALENHPFVPDPSIDDLRRADAWAREETSAACRRS